MSRLKMERSNSGWKILSVNRNYQTWRANKQSWGGCYQTFQDKPPEAAVLNYWLTLYCFLCLLKPSKRCLEPLILHIQPEQGLVYIWQSFQWTGVGNPTDFCWLFFLYLTAWSVELFKTVWNADMLVDLWLIFILCIIITVWR